MGKFRGVIDPVDLAAILGESGEGDDVVEIDLESGVDVVDEGFNILLRGCEGVSAES